MNRGWGDVFGYMLVASGRAEVMLDPTISIWDIAGVAPIIREAGGYFGNWAGEETIGGPDACSRSRSASMWSMWWTSRLAASVASRLSSAARMLRWSACPQLGA